MANKDGFFFVSNNLALDFVNTQPVLDGQPKELLDGFGSLLCWFVAAGLLVQEGAAGLDRRWRGTDEGEAAWRQILVFRERLREEILHLEAGKGVRRKTIAELNRLLEGHTMPTQIVESAGGWKEEFRFSPQAPKELLGPLVYAAADLFSKFDPQRIHKCQTCVLHFYDTTKNATRRWCSMKICGNRAKVASYVARHRDAD
jgi:predicted RNA-binding Zn ribbon-like protein